MLTASATAAAVLGLAGCAPPGYSEAPAVSKYLTQLMPASKREKVAEMAVCYVAAGWDSHWSATLKMGDGGIYHYRLHVPSEKTDPVKPVEQQYFTTEAWRDKRSSERRGYNGCIGNKEEYWVDLGKRVTAYVEDDMVVSGRFGDRDKLVLARAAQAAELAAAAHKKYVPVETTWGLKP